MKYFLTPFIFSALSIFTALCFGDGTHQNSDQLEVPFERLFTTSAQRRLIDHPDQQGEAVIINNVTRQTSVSPPKQVELSGVVLRSDGKHMVWINGESELSQTHDSVNARPLWVRKDSIKVPVRTQQTTVQLKPGQVWLPDKKRVEEQYQQASPQPVAELDLPSTSDND